MQSDLEMVGFTELKNSDENILARMQHVVELQDQYVKHLYFGTTTVIKTESEMLTLQTKV
jgi:hypothetical protein